MLKFDLPTRLDATNAGDIEEQLTRLITKERPECLICDFSATEYISSAGLRVMLFIAKKLKQGGAAFELHSMQHAVADVFRLSGLQTILDIRD